MDSGTVVERVRLCQVSRVCWNWRCGRASGVIQNDNSIKDSRSLFNVDSISLLYVLYGSFCITLQYRCYRFDGSEKGVNYVL